MKKLISAHDVEQYYAQGIEKIDIETDTIVTMLAQELANEYNIELRKKEIKPQNEISKEFLLSLLREILQIEDAFASQPSFQFEEHESGVMLIKGDTIEMNLIKEDKSGNIIKYQNVITSSAEAIEVGIWQMNEGTVFEEKNNIASIHYIVDGIVNIHVGDSIYTAQSNDIVWIPESIDIQWKCKQKTQVFYITASVEETKC